MFTGKSNDIHRVDRIILYKHLPGTLLQIQSGRMYPVIAVITDLQARTPVMRGVLMSMTAHTGKDI